MIMNTIELLLFLVNVFLLITLSTTASSSVVSTTTSLSVVKEGSSSSSLFDSTVFSSMLAGGLAGGISTSVLFPIDTIKTMRQSDNQLNSFRKAIEKVTRKGIKMTFLDRSKFMIRDLYSG